MKLNEKVRVEGGELRLLTDEARYALYDCLFAHMKNNVFGIGTPQYYEFTGTGHFDRLVDGSEVSNARGKVAKRLRRNVMKEWGVKLPDQVVADLGNIAQLYSRPAGTFWLEISTDLAGMVKGQFGDEGSCFYNGHASHRHAMHVSGRYRAILVYDRNERPCSRCWAHVGQAGELVLFNAYGDLQLAEIADLLGQCLALPVAAVKIDHDKSKVYVNITRAYYAIGPATAGKVYALRVPAVATCERCAEWHRPAALKPLPRSGSHRRYCRACRASALRRCSDCRFQFVRDSLHEHEGRHLCAECFEKRGAGRCNACNGLTMIAGLLDGAPLCPACLRYYARECADCRQMIGYRQMINITIGDDYEAIKVCLSCLDKRMADGGDVARVECNYCLHLVRREQMAHLAGGGYMCAVCCNSRGYVRCDCCRKPASYSSTSLADEAMAAKGHELVCTTCQPVGEGHCDHHDRCKKSYNFSPICEDCRRRLDRLFEPRTCRELVNGQIVTVGDLEAQERERTVNNENG